jgi:hypothetical protein
MCAAAAWIWLMMSAERSVPPLKAVPPVAAASC